ncbi:MAG TPA: response regulator transcription factor, partial [Anaerolineales bacterium]|nr:response regulator transcription factor [Anaerolineales bacterium]
TYLPDGNGVEAIREILGRKADTIVLVLTNYDSEDLFISAVRNGAKGYLDKRIPMANLVRAIEAIERGEATVSRIQASRLVAEIQKLASGPKVEPSDFDVLTPREMEVVRLLAANATNKEIADCLTISENTAKAHVHNILDKLNVNSRYQAARLARERGMSPPKN